MPKQYAIFLHKFIKSNPLFVHVCVVACVSFHVKCASALGILAETQCNHCSLHARASAYYAMKNCILLKRIS